ncbi:hypothetical protein D1AOALGA4SA_5908 [Olavius algarvensis Delta 1 endosymbiont]|nr:hypothetical protein D1AOALGA4SA_5908 [Olavius algarvensis Delta 1 endosymbiont]
MHKPLKTTFGPLSVIDAETRRKPASRESITKFFSKVKKIYKNRNATPSGPCIMGQAGCRSSVP